MSGVFDVEQNITHNLASVYRIRNKQKIRTLFLFGKSGSDFSGLVRETGLEPVRVTPHAPQTCASADSATLAYINLICTTCECLYTIPPFTANVKHFFEKNFAFLFAVLFAFCLPFCPAKVVPCLFNFTFQHLVYSAIFC